MTTEDAKAVESAGLSETLIGIYDAGGQVSRAQVVELSGDRETVTDADERLTQLGCARADGSLAGETTLTATGTQVAEHIKRSRFGGEARFEHVARGLLAWLAADRTGRSSLKDYFGQPEATAFGVPFTEDEIADAAELLIDNELVEGIPYWGGRGSDLLRPTITSAGRRALRSQTSIDDQTRRATVSMNNFTVGDHASIGGVQVGDNNTQTISQTVSAEQRAQLVALTGQLLRDGEQLAAPAREALEQVKRTAAKEASTAQEIKTSALDALVALTISAGMGALSGPGSVLLHSALNGFAQIFTS